MSNKKAFNMNEYRKHCLNQVCIMYCVKSRCYITRDLLYFMYIHMDIFNDYGFYGHYIFYRLLPIDLQKLSHYYHF